MNAIKALARVLSAAFEAAPFQLSAFDGGVSRNAIPRAAAATVAVPRDAEQAFRAAAEAELAAITRQYAGTDDGLTLEMVPASQGELAGAETTRRVLDLMAAIPSGVIAMSPALTGVVETSTSLTTAVTQDGTLTFGSMTRSSNAAALDETLARMRALARLSEADLEVRRSYPPWEPRLDSPLLATATGTFARLFGFEPGLAVVHGGLECAVLGQKLPGVEMISIGPEMVGLHAPGERVRISSTQRFYRLLGALLDRPLELGAPAAALESRTIHDGRPATCQSDDAELLLLTQHAIHGRSRRAGHRRDVLLRQRHDAVLIRRRELDEAPADASLRIDVVRLDDAIRRATELLGEKPQEHVLHSRVLPLEQREVVAEDRARLSRLERLHRRRATSVGEQKRELAEALTGSEDVDEDAVAERRQHARAEAAADDEVERVGGIVAMEDDLAAGERPAARDGEQPANVLWRQIGEQRPLHADSLCNDGDIRNVTAANDA